MTFVYNDGGRRAAGYKGDTGDCVTRAVAIATQQPYEVVYQAMAEGNATQRRPRLSAKARTRRESPNRQAARTAREGIHTSRLWFKRYMASLGWRWTPTMGIGTGCRVHLTDGELPSGRLIVAVSKHYTTVIDGVVHDTHDPQREAHVMNFNGASSSDDPRVTHHIARRCVYGYWSQAQALEDFARGGR